MQPYETASLIMGGLSRGACCDTGGSAVMYMHQPLLAFFADKFPEGAARPRHLLPCKENNRGPV